MPDSAGHHRLRTYRFSQHANWYILTTVTAHRRPLFTNPNYADIVAGALRHYHVAHRVHGFAWVVMPDHIHWVVQLRLGTLASLMRGFKTWTGARIRRLGLPGATRVWGRAFHDRMIREGEGVSSYIEYVVLNPVRAGLVSHPRDYPWVYGESEWLEVGGDEPPPVEVVKRTRNPPWISLESPDAAVGPKEGR